jgi:hypothetical protein
VTGLVDNSRSRLLCLCRAHCHTRTRRLMYCITTVLESEWDNVHGNEHDKEDEKENEFPEVVL